MNIDVGDGIYLTAARRSDKSALLEYLQEPEIYRATLRIPYPYTAADADRWLNIQLDAGERTANGDGRDHHWVIRDETERLVGGVSLEGLEEFQLHRAEIGYWLAKAFWRRGTMTNVVRAVCRFAFEQLGVTRITAHVFAFNAASARVLEKCGFVQEGICRQYYLKDGEFIDGRQFALVRDRRRVAAAAPGELLIRPFETRDEAEVVRLWNEVFPNQRPHNDPARDIRRMIALRGDLFFVGIHDGEVVATVMAGFDGHRGWLHRVAVAPHCQKRGFGRLMIAEADRRLAEIGCHKVNLQIRPENRAVVGFYRSLGYNTEDLISMGKLIG